VLVWHQKLSGGMLAWLCLGRGADVHVAQLMPLPLTISCIKSKLEQEIVLPFWCQLIWVVTDRMQGAVKWF